MVHRRQHELSLPLQQIKYQETILASCSSQSTSYPLTLSPSHFLAQVHTHCDKQFPRLKTFRQAKKRQLLSSLWLVAQSTLCSYPAPLPRQRAALRSKWCADHSGWVQLCPCHWISDCPSMSLPFVFINEVFSTRNMESLAITPPQKCLQVIDDRPGNDAKDVMNNK